MPTVLVVDDSPIDRQLVGGLLKQDTDWTVTYAGDGAAALDSIRTRPPDIVVTDLQMPEMTGLELVIAVRKSFAQVPVVLMTGKGSEEIAVEALHAGARRATFPSELSPRCSSIPCDECWHHFKKTDIVPN